MRRKFAALPAETQRMKSRMRAEILLWIGEPCPSCIRELGKLSRWRRARVLRFTNAIRCCQPHYTRSHSLARWLQNTPKPCKRPAPKISAPLISSAVNGGSSACCNSSRPSSAAHGRVPTRPRSSCPSPAPICATSPRRITILRGASASQSLAGKKRPGLLRPGFSLPTDALRPEARQRVQPSHGVSRRQLETPQSTRSPAGPSDNSFRPYLHPVKRIFRPLLSALVEVHEAP